MTISPIESSLYKPGGPNDHARIPEWMVDYARERAQQDLHSLVLEEFRRSGITQATLAERLGHERADLVCRFLRSPSNCTVGRGAEMLFGISGKLIGYSGFDPRQEAAIASTNAFPKTDMIVVATPSPGAPVAAHGYVPTYTSANDYSGVYVGLRGGGVCQTLG
jgi:hypothetical protein